MARRSARVVDKDLGFFETIKNITSFRESEIQIGFQQGSITHTQSKNGRTQSAGQSMPEIAAKNEFGFGSGRGSIPARPFMRTSFDENLEKINRMILNQYKRVTDGKRTADRALGLIGQYMVGLIQKKIRQITTPPNTPYTIAIKGSSKPLIDFGQMIQSVTYVVRK